MIHVRVDNIMETAQPFSPSGKNYTVYEWRCSGAINGVQNPDFIVKTLAHKIARSFGPGWQGMTEVDKYQGKEAYKIPKDGGGGAPAQPQNQPPAQPWNPPPQPQAPPAQPAWNPPPAPPAQPQAQPWPTSLVQPAQAPAQAWSPPVQQKTEYTLGELATLMGECIKMVEDIFVVRKDGHPEWRAMASMINTLFIEANRKGLKASLSEEGNAQGMLPGMNDQMAKVILDDLHGMLKEAGLWDRVTICGVPDAELYQLWQKSGGAKGMFVVHVNGMLQQKGA
jgi:hypothetical protein